MIFLMHLSKKEIYINILDDSQFCFHPRIKGKIWDLKYEKSIDAIQFENVIVHFFKFLVEVFNSHFSIPYKPLMNILKTT